MVEVVSILMVAVGAGLGALIVWSIMAQRSARLVESAKAMSTAEVAAAEAREGELSVAKSDMRKQMQDAFEIAATVAFKTAVKNADEEKESSFSSATEALSDSMDQYAKAIQEADKADSLRVLGLEKEIGNMSELGLTLADETRELTLALRGDSQAQGAWGEVVVENLLQSMGFEEGRDYIKQLSETGEDRKRKRTDFILNLPGNRQVVIDSKVSLTAYTEYVNAEDEDVSTTAMKSHCKSIRKHVEVLASKNYEHMESINTLDFVLMVVPLESAFIDAMRADPGLYEDIVGDRRVKVVSGTSFRLALLLIQELWKRENQSRNQMELLKRAGSLHDKVTLFLESFTEVGFELGQARAAYDRARTRLTDGPGNVIRQTEQMAELGAKVKKDLREKSGVRKLAEEAEMNAIRADSRTEMVVVEAEEEE
jgi:DNA recombination protein RmuC